MAQSSQCVVLIAPDFFADGFTHQAGRELLQLWRDGQILPAIHPALLVRYFRVFGRLGFSEQMMRWWGWWFSSPEKTIIVAAEVRQEITAGELCEMLAQRSGAQCVVCSALSVAKPNKPELAGGVAWMSAEQFIRIRSSLS